jgi:hypothetical protein
MSKALPVLAALLALAAFALPARGAEPMTFRLVQVDDSSRCGGQCAQAIAADGEITDSTPQQFLSFVSGNGQGNVRSVVFLNSPGGKVVASMELGQLFRKLGVAAIVARVAQTYGGSGVLASGQCYSACVYALMGGRKRVIPPQSSVGVHRMFQYEASLDSTAGGLSVRRRYDTGRMHSMLSRYSSQMGVNSGIIDYAERTSSDSLHVLSKGEIARWRLGQPKF